MINFEEVIEIESKDTPRDLRSLSDLVSSGEVEVGAVLKPRALKVIQSKYGDSPVALMDETACDYDVRLPMYLLQKLGTYTLEEENDMSGYGLKVYKYTNTKYNRDCFGVSFVAVGEEA